MRLFPRVLLLFIVAIPARESWCAAAVRFFSPESAGVSAKIFDDLTRTVRTQTRSNPLQGCVLVRILHLT